ncbi:hypothetical protein PVK06_007463 [Gossypium arboreum]|uniref:Uncharacterized protein n=1 Tax=Gossypium arboreum TaxID=29729 RepID=A0ABR0QHI3_GOSAR|nr:hypothetical protein PVK06_007463 [Gossypium arboreum]
MRMQRMSFDISGGLCSKDDRDYSRYVGEKDRIIETYIHNLSARAPCVVEQHLEKAGFLHVSRMLGRTKLEPTFISALMKRCRPTITLIKDMILQLRFLVDGLVITEVVHVGYWSIICHQLLGNVPNKFSGSRIGMNLLKNSYRG